MTMSDLGPQRLVAGLGVPARDWGRTVGVRAPNPNTRLVVIDEGPVPLALPRRISTKTEKCEANKALINRKKNTVHMNILLAKILAFSASQSQIKNAEFGGNRKVALILSWQGRSTVVSCIKNCAPHPHHEESRGLYKMRTHSQESVMRNKGFFLFHCFKDSHRLASVTK